MGGKEKNGFALSSLTSLLNLLQNILQLIMITAALGQVLEGMLQEVTLTIKLHTQAEMQGTSVIVGQNSSAEHPPPPPFRLSTQVSPSASPA